MNSQTIWNHLIAAGLTPEGAAGLMGNLYAESALDPRNLQNSFEKKLNTTDAKYTSAVDDGSYTDFTHDGAGYGLAQWTYSSRKANLLLYARNAHTSIGDLDTQIAFLLHELQNDYPAVFEALKTVKSVSEASDIVMSKYERPADQSVTQRTKRASYAQHYFDTYAKEDKLMATATERREKAVSLMKSRAKKNSYTQGGNRVYFFGHPDNVPGNTTQKGYSDCSSAVRAAIKAATGIDIGGNTSAQINNRKKKGIVVHETTGYYPDTSKLLPGDCLYFKGNESHPLDVGHVEMYIGDGKLCGHGSGTGPKIRNMMDYCKSRATKKRRYFMTIRWIPDGESDAVITPRNLKRDCEGNDVKMLQLDLIALGYSLGVYGADGDFGPNTEEAVKAFQTANGLTPDGVVGEETRKKIEALRDAQGDSDDDQEVAPVKPENGVTVADGTYNLRTGPNTNYPSAGVVSGGTVLEIVDLDGWIPVLYNGEVRFIGPKAILK